MNIKFSTNGKLRDALGGEELDLQLPDNSELSHVVDIIVNKLEGSDKNILTDADGNIHRGLLVVLNDEMVQNTNNLQLNNGDHISILMPMAGG